VRRKKLRPHKKIDVFLLLIHHQIIEFEFANETAEVEIYLQLSMQEKLDRAIDKKINSKISSISRTTKDVLGIVKKE
jgi:hypothetical protein